MTPRIFLVLVVGIIVGCAATQIAAALMRLEVVKNQASGTTGLSLLAPNAVVSGVIYGTVMVVTNQILPFRSTHVEKRHLRVVFCVAGWCVSFLPYYTTLLYSPTALSEGRFIGLLALLAGGFLAGSCMHFFGGYPARQRAVIILTSTITWPAAYLAGGLIVNMVLQGFNPG